MLIGGQLMVLTLMHPLMPLGLDPPLVLGLGVTGG